MKVRPYLFYDVAISICSTCFRRVDAKIVFTGQKVIRQPATLDGVALDIDLGDGKLTIAKVDAGITGGTLGISGVVDGSTPHPAVALKLTSRGV